MNSYILIAVLLVLAVLIGCTTVKNNDNSIPGPGSVSAEELDTVVTESGLKYIDSVQGSGVQPMNGQEVTVHYTGMFENGKKFDSSRGKKPLTFTLGAGRVIKGWDEGIMTMKEGGKRRLIIPPNLGYGSRGTPDGAIPPNATLIFDVELLSVK